MQKMLDDSSFLRSFVHNFSLREVIYFSSNPRKVVRISDWENVIDSNYLISQNYLLYYKLYQNNGAADG